jgi:hypothetical protein
MRRMKGNYDVVFLNISGYFTHKLVLLALYDVVAWIK